MNPSRRTILLALGNLVKQHRISLGLSQEELGFRCNLDRTYISGIERGVRNPSMIAIVSLAHGLNLTVSELFDGLETLIAARHEKN